MKIPIILAAVFASSLPALSQDEKPLPVARILHRADALQAFAPRGWMVEKMVRGDLNRDKIADCALVLVEKPTKPHPDDADNPATRARALVVLFKEGKGWHRVGFNNSLLLGTRDGGAFYGAMETPVNISIARGTLLVNQDSGSRAVTETTHKFRFDRRTKRLYLIGLERIDNDRLVRDSRTESTNFLTGTQKIMHLGENEREVHQTRRVSRKLRSLESVKVEERYSS